jgi:Protein of unknown function (DUF4238)
MAIISRVNHYVPRLYLRRWASSHERVNVYRTLVPHPRVPLWQDQSIRAVGYHEHLYTRIGAHGETDEIERWLNQEFETPAEEPLMKATSGRRMTPKDYRRLVRFLAAQDARTPARLAEQMKRWKVDLPRLLNETVETASRNLELASEAGQAVPQGRLPIGDDAMPFRLSVEHGRDEGEAMVKAEILAGRPLWLYFLRHHLTNTIKVLEQQEWEILLAPDGLPWFTSDTPVVRLNYYAPGKYDFGGGWDNPGTEIFLPLGPRHLMFCKVGKRSPLRRHDTLLEAQARLIRQFIAENARRMIFAAQRDLEVAVLRPRVVNRERLQREQESWRKWHEEQTTAEREFRGWSNGPEGPA